MFVCVCYGVAWGFIKLVQQTAETLERVSRVSLVRNNGDSSVYGSKDEKGDVSRKRRKGQKKETMKSKCWRKISIWSL